MAVLDRYVSCDNVKDVEAFLDECTQFGQVVNVDSIREVARKRFSPRGNVVNAIAINTKEGYNKGKSLRRNGGFSISYASDVAAYTDRDNLKEFTHTKENDMPAQKEEEPQQGGSQGEALPMSLREYYIGEVLKSTIAADSCALSSPTLAAKRIVGIVDAVIAEMGE